ncbi:hypothetical protein P152DRAFT_443384 [Eremomyces bilateralis CBS 781.70]|uniref:Vacuolar protein sorting-associated protein 8 central domain-containing protein n=1 Tax=Eremomyces bilateralis CBS 781.70 TaxID=1392243 RepID=A0A6G1FSM1_9PEZI|nr:uncharacterized protein P152DRAFT_443384 [Eremomyces bilateralis CBS 781.70]KAF1808720.1 hypothetical protein P152DRAFT_443384 [Eremomyces bilateralis CBS 781.70]
MNSTPGATDESADVSENSEPLSDPHRSISEVAIEGDLEQFIDVDPTSSPLDQDEYDNVPPPTSEPLSPFGSDVDSVRQRDHNDAQLPSEGDRPQSLAESSSAVDATPSRHASVLSSPASSSRLSVGRTRAGYFQPFDRRFTSRLSPSPLQTPRNLSPAFFSTHSRQSSLAGQLLPADESETPQNPWDVVRWTKLKRLSGQVFSETGKRNYGRPTCLAVAASIAIGTSKGLILVFDYQQSLLSTIGLGTKAIECGPVTSLAISADHSTVAGGHASGHIFTWELSRPGKPFLHIPPLERSRIAERRGDGHVADASVIHVGFLGTRHTALVSADNGGMAFSHLATRGLGAVGRTVKTTRILGRYPAGDPSTERARKPSSVLAFSPLPLGNVEQPTDGLGLTALLTPYLLVIVSTTPIAETQFKAARPKDLPPHSALSGCLAWFPAVRLKRTTLGTKNDVSTTKLAFVWSNIVTVLDVEAVEHGDADKPADVSFRPRSRWKCDEAIVCVQWLSRSVLAALTISQRLLILEDNELRVTDSSDMIYKHIFHQDLFSRQLRPVVEDLDGSDTSMHGVVADAFYMSFRVYKGRLFLLGVDDISFGTLSNWADRLLALMEHGDYIGAIELATSYYNGDADRLTVGLPEDDDARHGIVRDRLLELISASFRYSFKRFEDSEPDEDAVERMRELTATSFTACLSIGETAFLFDDVFDFFEDTALEWLFFDVLEPHVLERRITTVPPTVLQKLITLYASHDRAVKLEEIICQLDTENMDINLTTALCKKFQLYDALAYVWNQALGDFVTPLIEMLSTIDERPDPSIPDEDGGAGPGTRMFPYLAFALTGRVYPSGADMDDSIAWEAKSELYRFIFSSKLVEWPPGSQTLVRFPVSENDIAPYPYLRRILHFDAPSFMSVMNEAFEDAFLNNAGQAADGAVMNGTKHKSSTAPTRQTIVSILLDVMSSVEFGADELIYLDMFIARSMSKFPQFLLLPAPTLHQVLERLCRFPSEELASDCQLSVEYLLSQYHPADTEWLIPLLRDAGFYRVLKSIYRGTKQHAQLLEAYFEDPDDKQSVFLCIRSLFAKRTGLAPKQTREVENVIVQHAQDLMHIDNAQTAETLQQCTPATIDGFISALHDGSHNRFVFMRALFESEAAMEDNETLQMGPWTKYQEQYIQLMCSFDPQHVADYISSLPSGDLQLKVLIPAMEESGAIDAAVLLLARDGLVLDAMARLINHLRTLEVALASLMRAAADNPDGPNAEETADDLLSAIDKFYKLGIWLCQGGSRTTKKLSSEIHGVEQTPRTGPNSLSPMESMWVDLITSLVGILRGVSSASSVSQTDLDQSSPDPLRIIGSLRSMIQYTFTALLSATAVSRPAEKRRPKPRIHQDESKSTDGALPPPAPLTATPSESPPIFLRIFREFLTRLASTTTSATLIDLRDLLSEIFTAYAFESAIMALASDFLAKNLFSHVARAHDLRQRGWRPKGQTCEQCRRRVWGPGVGGQVWESWERRTKRLEDSRREMWRERAGGAEERGKGRGEEDIDTGGKQVSRELGPLIVFACRHIFHGDCLKEARAAERGTSGDDDVIKCPICAL